jgi:hypothetical protein
MMASYYRDSTRLCAVRFSTPFPSGLEASRDPHGAIVLRWDPYDGKAAREIEHTIHRSDQASFIPSAKNMVGRVQSDSTWIDRTPPPGQSFYRVIARHADQSLGTSWLTIAPAR